MTQPVVNLQSPMVTVKDSNGKVLGQGFVIAPWNSFFQQFVQLPTPITDVDVTGSPFTYEAKEQGMLVISGGTVSMISLSRGTKIILIGTTTNKVVPLSLKDRVIVTYSVLPNVYFVPR